MLFIVPLAWSLVGSLNEKQNVPIAESPPSNGLGLGGLLRWMTAGGAFGATQVPWKK
jgi:hypothetical protein